MTTAILTSYHSDCDDISAEAMALGLPPPMVCIPRGPSTRESSKRGTSPFEDVSTPTTSVAEHRPAEEKVGRWTEQEHGTFLEGLQLHGKQWKTIATMIGTRTVVQVRTHAQKYFQKLERKNKDAMAASIAEKPKTSKRKSLPSAMPSRKKSRFPGKKSYTRSQSLSLSAVLSGPPPSIPNPMSASSGSLSSSENLSTDSPMGVMDLDPAMFAPLHQPISFKDDMFLMMEETAVPPGFAEDPLEWLLDGEMHNHLPESSMDHAPMFPDFSGVEGGETGALLLQAQANSFDPSLLDTIADPKVTVQSLFLDETA